MAKRSVTDELITMDYNTLVDLSRKGNINSLKSVVKQLTATANRRINTLNKSAIGKYSPSLKSLGLDKEPLYSSKQINDLEVGKLMHQYSRLKQFLSAKTSKLSGWNKVRQQVAKRTGAKKLFQANYKSDRSAKIWLGREQKFWSLYNKLVDEYGGIISQLDSERIQEMLMKVQKAQKYKNDDDVSLTMSRYIENLYEAMNKGEDISDTEFEKEFRISTR